MPRTAWLEVDLDRLGENLRAIRARLPDGVRVEPVVKADAYGHGAVPVARALVAAGADGLCVAAFDEAAELRAAGIEAPLLVLYAPPPEVAPEAARLGIAVAASDMALLGRTLAVLRERTGRATTERVEVEIGPGAGRVGRADDESNGEGGSPNGLGHRDGPWGGLPPLRIHLEVETGMGRAGIAVADVPAAARAIDSTPGAVLAGLWSHLGSPDDEVRSAGQAARFGAAADLLRDAGIAMPIRHFAASGALLAGSAPTYDSVRPGLAIYGVVPDGLTVGERYLSTADALRPVMSLHAMPVRVAELASGTSISYGSTFVTRRRSRIATLPVGYADGLTRTLSNRTIALLRGRRVPLVGTIAMDAVMVDVTDVEGAPVTVDDEFVLLGSQDDERIGAVELGQLRTTISWEVLATMARRLPRVYHSAGRPVGLRTLTDEKGLWLASSSGTGISAISRSTRSSTRPTSRSGWPRG